MARSRFQNNLRFVLRKEDPHKRQDIPLNRLEKIGNILSWGAYELKTVLFKALSDPRFITICLTAFALLFSSLLFYPSDTWRIVSNTSEWIFDQINWSLIRFFLWFFSEITILGIGIRAFGRFSNQKLLQHSHVSG